MYLTILLILILIFECIYYLFNMHLNKNNKIEYYREIPSEENPAIVGFMIKGNVDGNDVIATILDLWKKGYVDVEYKIMNDKQQCIIKDGGKDRFLVLKDYENYLLDELFKEKQEVVLEDFVSSSKFENIFKNVGNMIKRRGNLKKTHNEVSYKRLTNKINFLTNYTVLGFAMFFPIIYLISNNVLLSIIIGYFISLILFMLLKGIILKDSKNIEGLLFGISSAISVFYLGILIITYLLSKYSYQTNQFLEIGNVVLSGLMLICFFIGDYNKKSSITFIDYIIFIYSLVSIVFANVIGLSICIIYFSHRIYLKSPKHVYFSNDDEIEKWIALKKFLNDFSIMSERDLMEVKIWDKYLIYGIAMGINKKIVLEYAKLSNIKLINDSVLDKCYLENIDF